MIELKTNLSFILITKNNQMWIIFKLLFMTSSKQHDYLIICDVKSFFFSLDVHNVKICGIFLY